MSTDKFSANETSISFEWPPCITGLERIALTAKGDLQRTLSAYFSKPIKVERVWEHPPSGPVSSASPDTPVTQVRQVNLLCEGQIVCVCVSTIKMSSVYTAGLFLDEHIAIGQMYRTLGRTPTFTLTNIGVEGPKGGVQQLWREYTLSAEGFECQIKETFPDRRMFRSDYCAKKLLRIVEKIEEEEEAAYTKAKSPRIDVKA
ncbi:hypothetical protein FS837_001988 [Tulasnella sp. UAMH 9824]|nr:hypothetical protein FS837_001988 [Tulasnella sp. UAMH 9824]